MKTKLYSNLLFTYLLYRQEYSLKLAYSFSLHFLLLGLGALMRIKASEEFLL